MCHKFRLVLGLCVIHCFNTDNTLFTQSLEMYGGIMARSIYLTSKVRRCIVPEDKKSWSVDFPEYDPPYFESQRLQGKLWADPQIGEGNFKWNSIDGPFNRMSFSGIYTINKDGFPLYPLGRTGIKGRGLLGHWGPNHAADPIVTRWKRDSLGNVMKNASSNLPILELVVIRRRDNKIWALPGGMVDAGEEPFKTAVREFMEEATNSLADPKRIIVSEVMEFFKKGVAVCSEIVDDPRNTDNAWMETSVFSFHDVTGEILGNFELKAGDDATEAKWVDVGKDLLLYASHLNFVVKVAEDYQAHW